MNDAVAGSEYPNRPAKTATAVGVVRLRHNGDYEDNARLLGRIVCAGQTLSGSGHDLAAVVAADYLATYSGHTRRPTGAIWTASSPTARTSPSIR